MMVVSIEFSYFNEEEENFYYDTSVIFDERE